MTSPQHPVVVGACELANHNADAEPVAMMVQATEAALASAPGLRDSISLVAVVKGINPYVDPGQLVADRLQLGHAETAHTQVGGNAPHDLLNHTAARIATGEIDAAIVCGAETMRTRRADKAAGRKSPYLEEAEDAAPDVVVGDDAELSTDADAAAGVALPVNFYAMAESALRHRSGRDNDEHLAHIAQLWARGSEVASNNPHARFRDSVTAEAIATHGPSNRRIAAPYPKLLTSNVNVDQAGALVVCSHATAAAAGIADDQMMFLLSGSGASDELSLRSRLEFDSSNAMRIAGQRALDLAGLSIDQIDHLDLYSCFPIAVQLAQRELGVEPDRPFTITGGMTFAGGPFNTYCLQALAHAFEMLVGTDQTALLHGNGGYFSKESFVVASGASPESEFVYERPQAEVDACTTRPPAGEPPSEGTIEAYTVAFDRDDKPAHAIISILDAFGSRHWAIDDDQADVELFLTTDVVSHRVSLTPATPTPTARLIA